MLGARGERNEAAEIRELAQLPDGIALRAKALLRPLGPRHLSRTVERDPPVKEIGSKGFNDLQVFTDWNNLNCLNVLNGFFISSAHGSRWLP
jgi:hypothetical protein